MNFWKKIVENGLKFTSHGSNNNLLRNELILSSVPLYLADLIYEVFHGIKSLRIGQIDYINEAINMSSILIPWEGHWIDVTSMLIVFNNFCNHFTQLWVILHQFIIQSDQILHQEEVRTRVFDVFIQAIKFTVDPNSLEI